MESETHRFLITEETRQTARIRQLNDQFRKSLPNDCCFITNGVTSLNDFNLSALMLKVITFNHFTEDNDPYCEHDFGSFDYLGHKLFWKIDTYSDKTLTYGADDPLSPDAVRTITIMLASEY